VGLKRPVQKMAWDVRSTIAPPKGWKIGTENFGLGVDNARWHFQRAEQPAHIFLAWGVSDTMAPPMLTMMAPSMGSSGVHSLETGTVFQMLPISNKEGSSSTCTKAKSGVAVEREKCIFFKSKINAVRREGVGRFPGLPLWTGWRDKGGYLPLILPLTSADYFCLSRYRRWDTEFGRLCILCR
jgi:hypothetical protein